MKMISKDDLYDVLGVSTKGSIWLYGLAGFGIGALCGSIAALLLAPKSGEELRGDLVRKTRETVDNLQAPVQSRPNPPV